MVFTMGALQSELYNRLTSMQKLLVIAVLTGMPYAEAWKEVRPQSKLSPKEATNKVGKILREPKVAAFLDSVREMSVSEAIMSREEALAKLTKIARTNLTDIVTFSRRNMGTDESGKPVYQTVWDFRSMEEMDPAALASISELSAGKDGLKIKQHDVLTAIRRMAEIQGWLAAKKIDHTSSDGSMSPRFDVSGLSDEAMQELLSVMDRGDSRVAGGTKD